MANGMIAAFPVGTTTVSYSMSDNCGKTETCSFDVTVNPSITLHVPSDVNFDCHENINGARVEWTGPFASSCCDDCAPVGQDLEGFVYMGRYKGHQYYCSKGMVNGEPTAYTNWAPGQPNNAGGYEDHTIMLGSGLWDDIYGSYNMEFIVEVPCLDVQQIAGPPSGSIFPSGTTTVTYTSTDNCGNTATESFNVNIAACSVAPPTAPTVCVSKANYSNYFWIKKVQVGSINNVSNDNGGYGDFRSMSTHMKRGSSQTIHVAPAFSGTAYWMYWTVWIDYNQDGDFNDHGEQIVNYKHYQPLQIDFRVPTTCKLGSTTMRVSMKYGTYANGCETFTYGEVEDYTVSLSDNSSIRPISDARNEEGVTVLESLDIPAPTGESLEARLAATQQPSLIAFPNPVRNVLTIDLKHIQTTDATLQIYNSLGQAVHTELLDNTDQQQVLLDVNAYKDGMYLISVTGKDLQPLLHKFTKF